MSVQTLKRFYLKKPTGKRVSFALYLQTVRPDGTTKNETIEDKDISAINEMLQTGVYTLTQAKAHAEKVRLRHNEALGVIDPYKGAYANLASPQNQRLLDKYWEAEYSYRQIIDEASALGKLKRAVAAVGELNLATATRGELTAKVKSLPFDTDKKRQITASLNQILKFARRDFKLIAPKKVRKKIKHLTAEEFELVMANMTCEISIALCRAAFLSGGRQGEVYAMSPIDLKGKQIYIETQLTRDEEEKDPKWGSVRPAYVFNGMAECLDVIQEYRLKGELPTRDRLRKNFQRACQKTFPGDRSKRLTYHDLRHSYAIRLLSKGIILDLVAQSLGNSSAVCQEYYAGYVLTHASLEMIASVVEKAESQESNNRGDEKTG